jgi:hypothetical protein
VLPRSRFRQMPSITLRGFSRSMSASISISNGQEFYVIPAADLSAARDDGFYVPAERRLTIVSNGTEVFEIPLDDVAAAQQDGFRDLLAEERLAGSNGSAVAETVVMKSPAPPAAPPAPEPKAKAKAAKVAMPALALPIDTHEEDLERKRQERAALLATLPFFSRTTARVRFWWEDHRRNALFFARAYGFSTGLNITAVVVLWLWALEVGLVDKPSFMISSAMSDANTPADEMMPESVDMNLDTSLEAADRPSNDQTAQDVVNLNVSDLPPATGILDSMLGTPGFDVQIAGDLAGRTSAGKQSGLLKYGGTMASERAVNESLKWLARHQRADGGWGYDLEGVPGCDCSAPGSFAEGRLSATGLALMTFLGAGHTSIDGNHAKVVKAGTEFLMKNGKLGEGGTFDMRSAPAAGRNEGIYEHAICTTALCESLALVRAQLAAQPGKIKLSDGRIVDRRIFVQMEEELEKYATAACKFLIDGQEPGGGWKYHPQHGNPPDTSIHGWCMMALISGRNAGIEIPEATFTRAHRFLDSVALEGGAYYGYAVPEQKLSTTGIGLLCRMYHGWQQSDEPLKKGVAFLSAAGPQQNEMYFNYYASQVLHHWGGDEWVRWNLAMREQLVSTQIQTGHEAGSWNVADAHGGVGGRHYMTCLATMTLEIYYRHLPIYSHIEADSVAATK